MFKLLIVLMYIVCNFAFTILLLDKNNKCDIKNRGWLGIRNKKLWEILLQYIILLPTMLLGWLLVLLNTTPFKDRKTERQQRICKKCEPCDKDRMECWSSFDSEECKNYRKMQLNLQKF